MLKILLLEAQNISGKKNHKFTLKADPNLFLDGAENELKSLFSNIIVNAIKYTPAKGRITIQWYEENNTGIFRVIDTGIGISKKQIPRITERFYRVDKARSRESGGTGLGLAIIKHIYHCNIKNYMFCPWIDENLLTQNKFYYFRPPSLNDKFDQVIFDYKSYFNVHYPFYLFEIYENYYESFAFATPIDNPAIINFYLNNLTLLENFKHYFRDKAASLIKRASINKIHLLDSMRSNIQKLNINKNPEVLFNVKKYRFNYNGKSLSLSKREMESCQYLGQGYTAKETANLLKISPRTVEQYLNNVKEKSGLKTKSQIADLMMRLIK